MSGIDEVVRKILERRTSIPDTRSLLVGVSGIDGSGKGYRIYFPAQRIHLAQDKPRENADLIFENDRA